MSDPSTALNLGHLHPPQSGAGVKPGVPLRLDALCERLGLLAHIGLPCMVYLSGRGVGQLFMGPLLRCVRENGRIVIEGDQFSLGLEERMIGQIYLADQDDDNQSGAAVELYHRDGGLITRICGLPDPVIGAVWRDLMDAFSHSTL
jgi:putative heme degradation protein